MRPIFWTLLPLIFLFFSCHEKESPIEKTFWIFPYKISSEFDPVEKAYFYVLFQDDLDYRISKDNAPNWIKMNEEFLIQGFSFEPGYFYRLSVMQSDPEKHKYRLIKTEEKLKDYSYLLDGEWIIKSINGELNEDGGGVIFRSKDRSFRINSKCLGVQIRIGPMDDSNFTIAEEFFDFNNGSEICQLDNMGAITSAFRLSKKYRLIEGQTLIFTDSFGNEVLELIK